MFRALETLNQLIVDVDVTKQDLGKSTSYKESSKLGLSLGILQKRIK